MKKIVIIPFQTVNYRCQFGCEIVLCRLHNFEKYVASGACEHIEVVVEAAQQHMQLTGLSDRKSGESNDLPGN